MVSIAILTNQLAGDRGAAKDMVSPFSGLGRGLGPRFLRPQSGQVTAGSQDLMPFDPTKQQWQWRELSQMIRGRKSTHALDPAE